MIRASPGFQLDFRLISNLFRYLCFLQYQISVGLTTINVSAALIQIRLKCPEQQVIWTEPGGRDAILWDRRCQKSIINLHRCPGSPAGPGYVNGFYTERSAGFCRCSFSAHGAGSPKSCRHNHSRVLFRKCPLLTCLCIFLTVLVIFIWKNKV